MSIGGRRSCNKREQGVLRVEREQIENLAYAIWEARNDGGSAGRTGTRPKPIENEWARQNAGNGVAEEEIASQLS